MIERRYLSREINLESCNKGNLVWKFAKFQTILFLLERDTIMVDENASTDNTSADVEAVDDENTVAEVQPQTATVTSRIESLSDEGIVGLTVGEAREQFAQALNISPNAYASIGSGANRQTVDEDYVIQGGDKVNFALALGEKGI